MLHRPRISISVVTHQQAKMVCYLLQDLQVYCPNNIEVILTVNLAEKLPFRHQNFSYPLITLFNKRPRGFGANHNTAFKRARGDYFCVLNPDIRLNADPFESLLECVHSQTERVGVVAPCIVNPSGKAEDSARKFPTPLILLKKAIRSSWTLDYHVGHRPLKVDWVAGMFMLFSADTYREMGGFNQKYFLYYEDIEMCTRFRLKGYAVLLCPAATAVHAARRESHRNIKYFKWHLTSILRYFLSKVFFKVVVQPYMQKLFSSR